MGGKFEYFIPIFRTYGDTRLPTRAERPTILPKAGTGLYYEGAQVL